MNKCCENMCLNRGCLHVKHSAVICQPLRRNKGTPAQRRPSMGDRLYYFSSCKNKERKDERAVNSTPDLNRELLLLGQLCFPISLDESSHKRVPINQSPIVSSRPTEKFILNIDLVSSLSVQSYLRNRFGAQLNLASAIQNFARLAASARPNS